FSPSERRSSRLSLAEFIGMTERQRRYSSGSAPTPLSGSPIFFAFSPGASPKVLRPEAKSGLPTIQEHNHDRMPAANGQMPALPQDQMARPQDQLHAFTPARKKTNGV